MYLGQQSAEYVYTSLHWFFCAEISEYVGVLLPDDISDIAKFSEAYSADVFCSLQDRLGASAARFLCMRLHIQRY